MRSVNKVILLGNLTAEPNLRYTKNGNPVINFSIATNRSYKDKNDEWQEQADFHNIVFWGKTAELISQLCDKGSKIYVEGRLQTRSWEDNDGKRNYKTEVVGRNFILLTPKEKDNGEVEETIKEAEEIFSEDKEPDEESNDFDELIKEFEEFEKKRKEKRRI
jgi:single-strand DNA-binding protein